MAGPGHFAVGPGDGSDRTSSTRRVRSVPGARLFVDLPGPETDLAGPHAVGEADRGVEGPERAMRRCGDRPHAHDRACEQHDEHGPAGKARRSRTFISRARRPGLAPDGLDRRSAQDGWRPAPAQVHRGRGPRDPAGGRRTSASVGPPRSFEEDHAVVVGRALQFASKHGAFVREKADPFLQGLDARLHRGHAGPAACGSGAACSAMSTAEVRRSRRRANDHAVRHQSAAGGGRTWRTATDGPSST